jgi:NAD(P)-dependent dehydrogenase (short-subunit alcohol dehydrogenase family)
MAGTELTGRSVVVTGAAHGIGRATAVVAAAEGASVLVADLDETAASGVADAIEDAGGRARWCAVDVSRVDDVERMVDTAISAFGGVDGLVCAAMRRRYWPAESFPRADWDMMIADGLTGAFLCAQSAARSMLAQPENGPGGSIVLVTSIAGHHAVPGAAAYSAVKAGMAGLTRQLGVEWADRRVRVNAVAPGLTLTEGAAANADIPRLTRHIPTGRASDAVEVARVVAFLLSDRAAQITGQEIVIDGGTSVGAGFHSI